MIFIHPVSTPTASLKRRFQTGPNRLIVWLHQPLAATIARLLKRSSGKCLLSHHERLLNSRGQDRQLQAFEAVARVEGLRVAIEMDTRDNLTMHKIKQTLTTRPNPRTMLVLRHGNQEKEQLLY